MFIALNDAFTGEIILINLMDVRCIHELVFNDFIGAKVVFPNHQYDVLQTTEEIRDMLAEGKYYK